MNPAAANWQFQDSLRKGGGRVKAFCCWSGGKESALSYYRSKKEKKKLVDY